MKKYILLPLFIFLGILNVFGQFHIIHIPDDKVMNIKADGMIGDWSWVKQKDYITVNSLTELVKGSLVNKKNFDCKFVVGWSGATNRIYVMAILYDDKRNTSFITTQNQFWLNDDIEVLLYPMVKGSEKSLCRFHFLVPVKDRNNEITMDIGPLWLKSYITHGWKMFGDPKKPGWTVYEFSMPVWDTWDVRGAQFSNRHNLVAGETFAMAIAFDDRDVTVESFKQWNTTYKPLWYVNPSDLSSFTLSPIKFDNTVSWDGISTVLKP